MRKALKAFISLTNIAIPIAATVIIAETTNDGYWIFARVWLPLLVGITITVVQAAALPDNIARLISIAAAPYILTLIATIAGGASLTTIILASGAVALGGLMVGHAMYIIVSPKFRKATSTSGFVTEVVIPHLFAIVPGLLYVAYILYHLLEKGELIPIAIAGLTVSIVIDGILIGKTLQRQN